MEKDKVAWDAVKGATKGGASGAAASIIGGWALTQVPVTFMWIPVATATVVSLPVVAGTAAAGAVIGGCLYGYLSYAKRAKTDRVFRAAIEEGNNPDKPNTGESPPPHPN